MFDKLSQKESVKAEKCYRELIKIYKKEGYMIYRSWITSMDLVVDKNDIFWDIKRDIKSVIDPNNIMVPWKYK